MSTGQDRAVLAFFADALVAVGWMVIGFGGLCTVFMGLLLGDSWHRPPLAAWFIPATILTVGGGFMWGGRRLRASLVRQRSEGKASE